MSLPKISIITPSYNQGKFIKKTIDSVLSQNYKNVEHIIVDGGSTDETIDILKRYGDKIEWISESDQGQTHAINKGLNMASGEVLSYLNSDDVLLPGSLQKVGEYFKYNSNCHWLTGDCLVIDENDNLIKGNWLIRFYKRFLMLFYSQRLLKIVDNMIPQPSTFWSRVAFEKIGPFNQSLHYVMDYEYWLRLSSHFKLHNLNTPLSAFRAQPESKSETSRIEMMQEGDEMLKNQGATNFEITLHKVHSAVVRFVYLILTK